MESSRWGGDSVEAGEQVLTLDTTCHLAADVRTRPENDGVTLLYGGGRMPFLANGTAAEVLAMVQEPRIPRAVVAEMCRRYPDVAHGALEADVLGLLARLISTTVS
jgi:hypothetical protein